MKTSRSFIQFWFRWLLLSVGGIVATRSSQAVVDGVPVTYSPLSQQVEGALPWASSYTLSVTSPTTLTSPVTVGLQVVCTNTPLVDFDTAAAYVTFDKSQLTFSGPGQTQTVKVSMSFPTDALDASVPSGAYTYKITTIGWPANLVIDNGATISSKVAVPAGTGSAPTLSILSPSEGTVSVAPGTTFPLAVPFTFSAVVDSDSPVITDVTASLQVDGGSPTLINVVCSGIGTRGVGGSGTFQAAAVGTYYLKVTASNSLGSGSDINTYPVVITISPPTITIASPLAGSSYTYRAGNSPTTVPFSFSASSAQGTITELSAVVDNGVVQPTLTNLNTAKASGTIALSYSESAQHTVSVTATDSNGNTVTTSSNFTVALVSPALGVSIQSPASGTIYTLPAGAAAMTIPVSIGATESKSFGVTTLSAAVGTSAVNLNATSGVGTASATASGNITLGPGTYQLVATGVTTVGATNYSATAATSFTVKAAALPPSVTITAPAANYSVAIVPGTTACIPLTFTGTSNTAGSVITQLTASLSGTSLAVNSSTLNRTVSYGASAMSVSAAGTYTIVVTAKDANGTAQASRTFTVTYAPPHAVCGSVFLDMNYDGSLNCSEFGLANIGVSLSNASGQVVRTATTDCSGKYAFTGLYAGTYTIKTTPYAGLAATKCTSVSVTMASTDLTAAPIGYMLDFCALRSMRASGHTIGYWKNNIDKAISGKTCGVQVSASTVTTYTKSLSAFGDTPFDGLTLKKAASILGSTSCWQADLLAKQLLASEYNYQNKAYLNGNAYLTYAFVAWGEAVQKTACSYSYCYVLWAKEWFDAYNNTEGCYVGGPCYGYSYYYGGCN